MKESQEILILGLVIASVVVLFIPFVFMGVRRLFVKQSTRLYKKSSISLLFAFLACLMVSIWCMRYAVGYFEIITIPKNSQSLSLFEEVVNSFLHALQTFSMDEDYTKYILNGKGMFGRIFPNNIWLQTVYGIYASILNFVAPLAGGAIIFEILASIFPKIKLHISYCAFWKEKYYFSELNEASFELAKNIRSMKAPLFRKPIVIFTDVYSDKDDERETEIFTEAKSIGAICIRDDLAHIKKNIFGKKKFFLIDEAELSNLQTLTSLSNDYNYKYLKKAEIYLFTNDDAYVQVEKSIRDKLKNLIKEENLPVFISIQRYRNLISNLLVEIPLYEPLISKKGEKELTVTILGTGYIGTEMFLSTYWFGQILGYRLKINVISQETEEQFWSKIDYVNPEIRHTTIDGHQILRFNNKGENSPIYCKVNYLPCDAKSSEFISCLTNNEKNILDTDYFLVSLGTDEGNISVANTIRKYVGEYHIAGNNALKTIITYVVYNSELSEILNRQKYFKFVDDNVDVYMKAIGSLKDVYSVKNVFFPGREPFELKDEEDYDEANIRNKRAKDNKERLEDEYKYWARLARKMHIKYKAFSMGLFKKSLFDYPDLTDEYISEVKNTYAEYIKIAMGKIEFDNEQSKKEHLALLHNMSWIEHRRWNAFTRIKGFRSTKHYDVYAKTVENGTPKQMDIKLHPCLVECDTLGIRAAMNVDGTIAEKSSCKWNDYSELDFLDELSQDLYNKGYVKYDYKIYDYPMGDLSVLEDKNI